MLKCHKQSKKIHLPIQNCVVSNTSEIKYFDQLNIHPSGLYCENNCSYCINSSNNKNNTKFLSQKRLYEVFSQINSIVRMNSENFIVKYSGGDPISHPYFCDIFRTISDKYLKIPHSSKIFYKWNKYLNIENIISTEYCNSIKIITSFDSGKNIHFYDDFLELYKKYKNKKIKFLFNFLISEDTTVESMLNYLERFIYLEDLELITNIVIYPGGTKNHSSFFENIIYPVLNEIGNHFYLTPFIGGLKYFISKDKMNPLPEDLFIQHKENRNTYHFYEPNFCSIQNSIGFDEEDFFSCFYGLYRSNTLDELVSSLEKNYRLEETSEPNECLSCINYNYCKYCSFKRKNCVQNEYQQKFVNKVIKDWNKLKTKDSIVYV